MESSQEMLRNRLPLIFANLNRLKLNLFNTFQESIQGEREERMSSKYVV